MNKRGLKNIFFIILLVLYVFIKKEYFVDKLLKNGIIESDT